MISHSVSVYMPATVLARTHLRSPQGSKVGRTAIHLQAAGRRIVTHSSVSGREEAVQYQELDIVEFISPEQEVDASSRLAIGCIVDISGDEVSIEELQREAEPNSSTWTQSGEEYVIPISALRRTFEADYSQRMDTDRISNPHGEHAHDVWDIPDLL